MFSGVSQNMPISLGKSLNPGTLEAVPDWAMRHELWGYEAAIDRNGAIRCCAAIDAQHDLILWGVEGNAGRAA